MNSEELKANEPDAPTSPDATDANRRERSLIEFPYSNLEDAEEVAAKLFHAAGMSEVSPEQAGAALTMSSASSTFRVAISSAKMFGLLSPERGSIRLTELGQDIAQGVTKRSARVKAFLRIPLYKSLTDTYDGRILPPASALEREMAKLGVASKQTARARQAFDRSARHAEFIKAGSDRFVTPILHPMESRPEPPPPSNASEPHYSGGNGGAGNGGGQLHLDPLLMALLQKIPPKEEGWSAAKRVRWFRTFAMNVSQVYDNDEAPVELKIEATTE